MYTLYGDGIHDDTKAIQEMLDSGICEVALPAPRVKYCISETLRVHSKQTLRLPETAEILLMKDSWLHLSQELWRRSWCVWETVWKRVSLFCFCLL